MKIFGEDKHAKKIRLSEKKSKNKKRKKEREISQETLKQFGVHALCVCACVRARA